MRLGFRPRRRGTMLASPTPRGATPAIRRKVVPVSVRRKATASGGGSHKTALELIPGDAGTLDTGTVSVFDPEAPLWTPVIRALIVGEVDFSFSRALIGAHGDASKVMTSMLRDMGQALSVPGAVDNMTFLNARGATILDDFDAIDIKASLARQAYDSLWMFELVAFTLPYADTDGPKSVRSTAEALQWRKTNADLVSKFLQSACEVLTDDGEIILMLHISKPTDRKRELKYGDLEDFWAAADHTRYAQYYQWDVETAAISAGLELNRSFDGIAPFPGYIPHTGHGPRFQKIGRVRSYVFRKLSAVMGE